MNEIKLQEVLNELKQGYNLGIAEKKDLIKIIEALLELDEKSEIEKWRGTLSTSRSTIS